MPQVPVTVVWAAILSSLLVAELAAGSLHLRSADDDVTSGGAPSRLIQGRSFTVTRKKELEFSQGALRHALLILLQQSWRNIYKTVRKQVQALERGRKTLEGRSMRRSDSSHEGELSPSGSVSRRSVGSGPAYDIPPEVVSLVLQGWRQHLDRQSDLEEDPLPSLELLANGRGRGDISIGLDVNALKLAMADMDRLDYQGKMRMAQAKLINIGKRDD